MARRKDGWFKSLLGAKVTEAKAEGREPKGAGPEMDPPEPPPSPAGVKNEPGGEGAWAIGQLVLGDYRVEGELGEGGMGKVYLVKSVSTGQQFAAKRAKFQDRKNRNAFLRELQTWIDLPDHPNLVPFRFFRTVGDEIVIFAEYVEGGSLQDWTKDRRLYEGGHDEALKRMLDVAIQFAWGLHAAHDQGLVHQDVKPGNVLATAAGEVKVNGVKPDDASTGNIAKVTDFGLARACKATGVSVSVTSASQQGGSVTVQGMTIAYRSPEQARGDRLDHKTDIWSWGMSVLEMFNGEVTWLDGKIAREILANHLERSEAGDIDESIPKMPESLAELLKQCFESEPAERPESMLKVAKTLVTIHKEEWNHDYVRPVPVARSQQLQTTSSHDRRTTTGVHWRDPRHWLELALKGMGRDPAEADDLLLPRIGSRRAQAIADMAGYEEAQGIFEELVERRQDLSTYLAELYADKALVHEHLGDIPGSLALCNRAIELLQHHLEGAKQLDARKALAVVHVRKGILLDERGSLSEANDAYDQAIELYEQLVQQEGQQELSDDLALAYMNKATTIKALGEVRVAVTLYDRVIEIHERLQGQDRPRMLLNAPALAYSSKAGALMTLGDNQAAVTDYEHAIELLEQLVNNHKRSEFAADLARTYSNKAIALDILDNAKDAVATIDQAIEIYNRVVSQKDRQELRDALAWACTIKAYALIHLGDPQEAKGLADQALEILERLVYREGQSELFARLAETYSAKACAEDALRNYGQAAIIQDRAIAVLEPLVQDENRSELAPDLAVAYENKAVIMEHLDDHRAALQFYDRSIAVRERLIRKGGRRDLVGDLAKTILDKADLLDQHGEFHAAVGSYVEAVEVTARHASRTHALHLLATITAYNIRDSMRDADQYGPLVVSGKRKIAIYERLLDTGRWSELRERLAQEYVMKARLLEDAGHTDEAISVSGKGIAIYDCLIHENGRDDLADDLVTALILKATAHVSASNREPTLADFRAALSFCEQATKVRDHMVDRGVRLTVLDALAKAEEIRAVAVNVLGL